MAKMKYAFELVGRQNFAILPPESCVQVSSIEDGKTVLRNINKANFGSTYEAALHWLSEWDGISYGESWISLEIGPRGGVTHTYAP